MRRAGRAVAASSHSRPPAPGLDDPPDTQLGTENTHGNDGPEFVREDNAFEPWFNRAVVEKLTRRLPRAVHPNMLTVLSAVVIVAFTALGVGCSALEAQVGSAGEGAGVVLGMRSGVGALILLYAVLDCMDGVHARATGQCSKIGEALDHWVDAFGVPLTAGAVFLTMGMDNATLLGAMIGAPLCFSTQLAVYHETGKWVATDTSGVLGQLACAFMCPALGALAWVYGRDSYAVVVPLNLIGVLSVAGLWDNARSFSARMGWKTTLRTQWPTLACGIALAAVFWAQYRHPSLEGAFHWREGDPPSISGTNEDNWFTTVAFVCLSTCLSLRVCGTYVLAARTDLWGHYDGFDAPAALWTAVIVAAHFARHAVATAGAAKVLIFLPFAGLVHLALLSILDLRRAAAVLLG